MTAFCVDWQNYSAAEKIKIFIIFIMLLSWLHINFDIMSVLILWWPVVSKVSINADRSLNNFPFDKTNLEKK